MSVVQADNERRNWTVLNGDGEGTLSTSGSNTAYANLLQVCQLHDDDFLF